MPRSNVESPAIRSPVVTPPPARLVRSLRTFAARAKRIARAVWKGLPSKAQRALTYAICLMPGGPARGMCLVTDRMPLTPPTTILSYGHGLFPLANRRGRIRWHSADPRAVIELDKLHIPARMRTYVNKDMFEIAYDTNFRGVVEGCARRRQTWISRELIEHYVQLHELGVAHSVESYQDGKLVGGGFGLALGDVFTIESMFTAVNQASKVAFVHLARHLHARGFRLIDCQYLSHHWIQFGAVNISFQDYREHLARALINGQRFRSPPPTPPPHAPRTA